MSWISRRKQKSEPDLVVEVQPAPLINRERLAPYVDVARVRVDTARDRVTPYVDTARGKVAPYAEHARDWAAHGVEDAKLRAVPVVAGAVEKYVPRIEHALDEASSKLVTVLESAGPARDEVQRRGTAAVAALKGEVVVPDEQGGRWVRRFAFVGLLTGLGAAAFAFFRRRQDEDAWITSDAPYPTYGGASSGNTSAGDSAAAGSPVGTTETAADDVLGGMTSVGEEPIELSSEEGADAGGAGPDETAADAAYEPGEPSTPADPAERITPKDVAEHIHPRDA